MLNTLDENESSEPTVYFKKFTIGVFGDSGVGKSSIVRRLLVSDDYNAEHEPTVEEFYVKQMTHRNKAYELHIRGSPTEEKRSSLFGEKILGEIGESDSKCSHLKCMYMALPRTD